MNVAHDKLPGLDRDRLLAVVEPILRAHHVEGVELIWRTDRGGWLLELTVERPDARRPGDGITVELCSDISKDLSAALDVADVIPHTYRLEVGSPGLERALYTLRDYERFAGELVRIKLREPLEGQAVVRGKLMGLDDSEGVVVETERGIVSLALETIESARLVFDWKGGTNGGSKGTRGTKSIGRRRSENQGR